MYRRIYIVLLVSLLSWQFSIEALASNRPVHDKQMQSVLFGRENYYASQPKEEKEAIEALECAVYLCLDQFNGQGGDELRYLREYGVRGLTDSVDDIDFSANPSHRKYTHMGWEPVMQPAKGNWDVRKEILLATVDRVFHFSGWSIGSILGVKQEYSQQCDAMCALLYYVHVLGDLIELKDLNGYKKNGSYTIQLAVAHADENTPDILWWLTSVYLPNLFSDDTKELTDYSFLMKEIEKLARKARLLVGETGGINTEEKFNQYKGYCAELMDVLESYVPRLLRQEAFFVSVFPEV